MRKIASIQQITEINEIPGADKIEALKTLSWQTVAQKGEFKVGEPVVFVEVDGVLPRTSWTEFLFKPESQDKTFRIKTCRLRKALSQGICFKLTILPDGEYEEGMDVTELLGITQYIPEVPANLSGRVKGGFPGFLRKTDSLRIQSYPDVINEFRGKKVYASIKVDGTSFTTYYRNGDFGVCSRNFELQEEDGTVYWEMVRKYNLKEKLQAYGKNLCIQAECHGNGVQKNRMGLPDTRLAVFDIYDIDNQQYLNFYELKKVTLDLGLETVQFVYEGEFNWTVESLLEFAEQMRYPNGSLAEGVVVRPLENCYSQVLGERLAIKAISNAFLLKYGE